MRHDTITNTTGPNGVNYGTLTVTDGTHYTTASIPFKSMEQDFIERIEKLEKMLNQLYYPYRGD